MLTPSLLQEYGLEECPDLIRNRGKETEAFVYYGRSGNDGSQIRIDFNDQGNVGFLRIYAPNFRSSLELNFDEWGNIKGPIHAHGVKSLNIKRPDDEAEFRKLLEQHGIDPTSIRTK